MKTILTALAATLIAGSAMAAASDIRVSTDPTKIAAIEKHAKELQARDQAAHPAKAAAPAGSAKSGKTAHKHKHSHSAAKTTKQ